MKHSSFLSSRSRLLLSVAALAISLAGCGATDGPIDSSVTELRNPLESTQLPASNECRTNDLEASTVAGGTADNALALTIKLTNKTDTPCTLEGYATVGVFNNEDTVFDKVVRPSAGTGGLPTVTVTRTASAYFDLRYHASAVGDENDCTPATRLTIAPPDQEETLRLPLTNQKIETICPSAGAQVTRFRPTQAG